MVFNKVRKIVSEQFAINEDGINMETSFKDDLNADSLDLVELVMGLEDEFDMQVEDDSVEDIKTVGDVVNYIEDILDK